MYELDVAYELLERTGSSRLRLDNKESIVLEKESIYSDGREGYYLFDVLGTTEDLEKEFTDVGELMDEAYTYITDKKLEIVEVQ